MRARVLALIAMFAASLAAAADVSVSAQFSHRTAEVGSQVQFQIEIKGAGGDVTPPTVQVDGLEVRFAFPSTSHQVQFINGRMTSERKTTLVYEVVPKREGDFLIPPLQLEVEGKIYRTEPAALKVQKGGAMQDGSAPLNALAEIEVKRTRVYLGEVVPVEVRLLADERMRVEEVPNMPELTGDGFTIQKFPKFTQSKEVREGREYTVVSFRTAMTPTKAGKLSIGPCEIPFIAQVQRAKRQQRRSLFDQFFSDDFFNPLNTERRRFTATAAAVELDVRPLPVDGRPRSFSGAVGQFEFEASGSPAAVKIGEPVTMRLVVSGDGNFDRVQVPVQVNASGWKAYDAAEKFEPENDFKTSGKKTFEIPVVPEVRHRVMPQFEFSYFDPEAEKYVALTSKVEPLEVQGEPLVAPAPVATPTPEATPAPRSDIAGIRYEEGARRTFAPVHTRAGFWIANGVAALVALGLVASRWLRSDPAKARAAGLRREREDLMRTLRGGCAEFYEKAARLVQVETALRAGVEAASVDAAVAKRVLKMEEGIDAIFDARAERLYAGGAVEMKVSSAERERIMPVLERVAGR